jgi:CDP-paratose 2-epimerase
MRFRNVLITGGAGFVGSNLAVFLRRDFPEIAVTAVDNLKRRGSELTLPRLKALGIDFHHADIRCPEDLADLPPCDLVIDCSAEPSVHAGGSGSPLYVLNTNLGGTINCLELARQRGAAFLFLSTSRVYPIEALNRLEYREEASRYRWVDTKDIAGFSEQGVAEQFPLDGARSMYGASKLACELIIREFVHNYKLPALINRCGVLAGPWQMGRVDQGVITLWCARHYYRRPLRYTGFGGTGKQVRDVLHIEDLYDLLVKQIERPECWDGSIYNAGGGNEVSASLCELTDLCRRVTGNTVEIASQPETSPLDLRIYITDSRVVARTFDWRPQRSVERIVTDIHHWIHENSEQLKAVLA